MPDTGIISQYRSEGDLVVEWRIPNFLTLPEEDCAYYWSPSFSFGGARWSFCISPNGSSGRDSSGHVDLELWKYSGRSMRQSFSLSLKTAKGEKYHEEHYTRDFKWIGYHAFDRFIQRSELTRRRSELVPEGVLTVVCTMKSSLSAGSESDTVSAQCLHCKGIFNADSLSSHRKKCMHRPTKCPDCLEVVSLKKWLIEHECQQGRPQGTVEPA